MKREIILASNSPRRKELLLNAGYTFTVESASFDEDNVSKELPVNMYVSQLALFKACSVAKYSRKDALVIGADTVVYKKDFGIMGKPRTREEAFNMLKGLSGTHHSVFTGIAVVRTKDFKIVTDWAETFVYFKELSDDEIYYYIDNFRPYDKAGAYGIQEYASRFAEKIEGDYFNVVGLPVSKLDSLIKKEFIEE